MSTVLLSLAALGLTTALLAVLAARDPKRLRNARGSTVVPLRRGQRRLLGWGLLLPGVALAVVGQWPAFLIWLGASCTLGWALAQWFAPRGVAVEESDAD